MPGRTPTRTRAEQAKVIRHSNIEVLIALSFAGVVNLAMVAMAASMFHLGHPEVAEIETAYHTLLPLMGGFAALVFMTSMCNDLVRGNRLELPWFAGKVVELGRLHGIPTPANGFVHAALKLYVKAPPA